jgi:hypothetical protein
VRFVISGGDVALKLWRGVGYPRIAGVPETQSRGLLTTHAKTREVSAHHVLGA